MGWPGGWVSCKDPFLSCFNETLLAYQVLKKAEKGKAGISLAGRGSNAHDRARACKSLPSMFGGRSGRFVAVRTRAGGHRT
jgi:hypothetical protein